MRAAIVGAALSAGSLVNLITPSASVATEGASLAGPIGGTDIRSAMLPPPGLYGGVAGVYSSIGELRDGGGHPAAGLDAVDFKLVVGGPFFLYVPNVQFAGGQFGVFGVIPMANVCNQLVSAIPKRCMTGLADPYVETAWSRSLGHVRPASALGAFPIVEGLTVELGLGTVLPLGRYDAESKRLTGTSDGSNIFDLAPSFAVTYTTPPLIVDGTEFSAKLFWNNYATNPATQYKTGQLIDIDFALTEHVGRFQVGLTGYHAFQIEDDRQFGVPVPPDGRRADILSLGGIVNCDLAEIGAAIRVKYLATVTSRNNIMGQGVVVTFGKKLY